MKNLILISLFFFTAQAHARVFTIDQASFATYFKGTFGNSVLQKHPYDKTSGAQTEFSDQTDFNLSGEIGFIFPHPHFNFKLGVEILSPLTPSNLKGKNSSGQELMSVDSSILGLFPVAHLEYVVARNNLGRVYFSVGGGYGRVSLSNDYTLTALGTSTYSLSSFKDSSSQYTYIAETSLGYEMSFVQSVTVAFDFGYRYCVAKDLKYGGAGTNFIGSHSDGDSVVESDGSAKNLDLSGVFTGLSFRFYFN